MQKIAVTSERKILALFVSHIIMPIRYSPKQVNLSNCKTKERVGKFSAICVGDFLRFIGGERRYFFGKIVWSRD